MAVGWTVAKAVPLPPSGVVPDISGRVAALVLALLSAGMLFIAP